MTNSSRRRQLRIHFLPTVNGHLPVDHPPLRPSSEPRYTAFISTSTPTSNIKLTSFISTMQRSHILHDTFSEYELRGPTNLDLLTRAVGSFPGPFGALSSAHLELIGSTIAHFFFRRIFHLRQTLKLLIYPSAIRH